MMMLFAIGFANAENAKVKVELNPTTWKIGNATAVPQFTVTITQATTEEGGEAKEADLALGTEAGNVAVKVTLTNASNTANQIITSATAVLETASLTEAGAWTLTYELVKGDDQSVAFENVDMDASSTNALTVEAADPAPAEKTDTPTFKVGEEVKTSYELAVDEEKVTVTIVAADGATVYYTTDGTEPTTSTTTTGTSVEISNACTLKAIAKEEGKDASDVASFEVTKATAPVVEKVAAPTFNPRAGEVDANTTVTIATTTADAKVYYRKDTKIGEYTEYTEPVAITEACTLYACAVKDDMTPSDTVSAAYTIVAVPEDDEDAPALTFTPANTDSVDNNTEILVTGDINGCLMEYGTYASISAAKQARMGYTYGSEGYPTVTEGEPVLKIFLTNLTTYDEYAYYRVYKVRAASDVPMPTIVSENAMAEEFGLYPKGDKVKILAEDEGYTIWYTTDGSKPAIDGTTSTKIEGGAGEHTLNASVTIKAIAVKDGKASDVATAHFTLYEDVTATLTLYKNGMPPIPLSSDDTVGKNSPIPAVLACAENAALAYMYPYTVYYTTDGVTEPSKEAYTENGNIKKSESLMGEWGPEGNPSVAVPYAGATIKAKAYMHVYIEGELDEWIVSQTLTYTVNNVLSGVENPEFSVASGEVRMGDTIRIKNPNVSEPEDEDEEEAKDPVQIYFSLNGPLPTSDLITAEPMVVYRTEADEDVVIVIKKDEKGTYAYVPGNENFLYVGGTDKIYFEGNLKVQAICYGSEPDGTLNQVGRPNTREIGSDFVEASYSVMKDFPMPVITPDGGMVRKGTEVTIAAGEGLEIYYTVNDSVPEVGKTFTTKYEDPIVVNEAMTVKAIAFKAKTGDEGRDSLSAVAVAVFTLIPDTVATPTFSREEGVVEAGAEVELACTTQGATIYYTLDGTVPTQASEVYSEAIVIEETTTIKAIAMKEGMAASKEASATYEVEQEVIEPITFTFNPAAGSEVEDGTQITITPSRELGEDEVIIFAMFATQAEAEACTTEEMVEEGRGTIYGEPVEGDDEVGYPVVTEAAPVLKVGYLSEIDAEGNLVFSWTYAAYTVKTVSNEEAELAGVAVYPNPSEGLFSVTVPVKAQVEVFTATGMMVRNFTVTEGTTQLHLENTGIYFVRFTAENGQVAVKRVIVR